MKKGFFADSLWMRPPKRLLRANSNTYPRETWRTTKSTAWRWCLLLKPILETTWIFTCGRTRWYKEESSVKLKKQTSWFMSHPLIFLENRLWSQWSLHKTVKYENQTAENWNKQKQARVSVWRKLAPESWLSVLWSQVFHNLRPKLWMQDAWI